MRGLQSSGNHQNTAGVEQTGERGFLIIDRRFYTVFTQFRHVFPGSGRLIKEWICLLCISFFNVFCP